MSNHEAKEPASEASEPQARHALPDDFQGERPLIDLSRDPTPGVPDHARPDED
jgi:hypothetical protein